MDHDRSAAVAAQPTTGLPLDALVPVRRTRAPYPCRLPVAVHMPVPVRDARSRLRGPATGTGATQTHGTMNSRIASVSAFERFGPHAVNPTREALLSLRERGELSTSVVPVVLPVTFDGAATVLLARAARERATACLILGLAAGSDCVRVERYAYNEANSPMR